MRPKDSQGVSSLVLSTATAINSVVFFFFRFFFFFLIFHFRHSLTMQLEKQVSLFHICAPYSKTYNKMFMMHMGLGCAIAVQTAKRGAGPPGWAINVLLLHRGFISGCSSEPCRAHPHRDATSPPSEPSLDCCKLW